MMNLKNLFNKDLFKNTIKNNLLFAKVSLMIFLGFFVLSTISAPLRIVCMLIFVVSAVILTTIYPSLIHKAFINKNSAALLKSFPLSSYCIWFTNYLSGYLIVLVTLLIEGIGVVLISLLDSNYYFSAFNFGRFFLMIFVLLFIYYTVTFLFSSMSGNRLGQIVFSISAYTLPVIVLLSLLMFSEYFIPNSVSYLFTDLNKWLFPLIAAANYIHDGSDLKIILVHCIIALILLIISYYIYFNRDDEYIGQPLVFNKIVILLKSSIVLICTIIIFYLILFTGQLVITFDIKGVLLLFFLYIIIGIIVAIGIEIIFKSNHIYRKVCLYSTLLGVFFIAGYFLVNNWYLKNLDEIFNYSQMSSNIYYNLGGTLSLTRDETKDLVKWLNKHRENITSRYNDYSCILQIEARDQNKFDRDFSYYFDKNAFVAYFNNKGEDYFDELMGEFGEEKYLIVLMEKKSYYLNATQVKQLYQMTETQKLKPENFFDDRFIRVYNNDSDREYLFEPNEQIITFIKNECSYQSEVVEACYEFMSNSDNYLINDGNSVITNYVEQQLNFNGIENLYISDYRLVGFDEKLIYFEIDLTATNETNSIERNLIISLKYQDGIVVVDSVVKGGD